MLDEYAMIALLTLDGFLIIIVLLLGAFVKLEGYILSLKQEIEFLSKDNKMLFQSLSKENDSIKKSIDSIAKEFLKEQMARENLYKNTDRAKEILETMDMMKEVVMQNAQLNATITQLEVKNQELINQKNQDIQNLLKSVNNVRNQLSNFEGHRGFDEADEIFGSIQRQFSDFL